MTRDDAENFAKGLSHAIQGIRSVYSGVRTMLSELEGVLEQPPEPKLFDLGIHPRSDHHKNPDERILRSWQGRFYNDEPLDTEGNEQDEDDEGGEDLGGKGKLLPLVTGQNLGFMKVVLYQPNLEAAVPHVLFGVLRDCRIPDVTGPLPVRAYSMGRVLDVIDDGIRLGDLRTKALVAVPRVKSVSESKPKKRLVFTVDRPPERLPLYDIRGPEQLREIAATLKALWT